MGPSHYKYRRCSERELFWARFGLVSTDAAEYRWCCTARRVVGWKIIVTTMYMQSVKMLLKISQVYLFENRVAHRKNPSCYQYSSVTGWVIETKFHQHFFHQHFFRSVLRNLRLIFHSVNPAAHADSREPRLLKIVASFGRN